jgi:hypothetical protein
MLLSLAKLVSAQSEVVPTVCYRAWGGCEVPWSAGGPGSERDPFPKDPKIRERVLGSVRAAKSKVGGNTAKCLSAGHGPNKTSWRERGDIPQICSWVPMRRDGILQQVVSIQLV